MNRAAYFCLTIALVSRGVFAAETPALEPRVQSFFQKHCIRCHGPEKQKGDFRLDTLSRDFAVQATGEKWAEVLFRMNGGEMPPKKEAQPTSEELGSAADWIASRLKESEATRIARRAPVTHYRLSREEYGYTVQDLLGVHYDVNLPGAFNEDPRWHGFERIGSMLTLSPSHVERYITAAETVLDLAFTKGAVKSTVTRRDASFGLEKWRADHPNAGSPRMLVWQGRHRHMIQIGDPGIYHIRIQLSGLQPPGGRAPHLSLWHHQTKRSVFDQDVLAPEEKPAVIDIEMPMSPGSYDIANETPGFNETGNHTLNVLNNGDVFVSSRATQLLNPTGYKLFDDDYNAIYPMLIVDWVEWEGPILKEADRKKREGLVPTHAGDLAEARQCLKRLADRAWRRPASDAEIDRFVKVIKDELAAKEAFPAAYRAAMVAVLSSKNFYYITEGSPTQKRDRLNDYELATRLSYFLWSSMPDEELFEAAQNQTLHQPAVLAAQVKRMLADPRISRLNESFPRQWLQLDRVGMFAPDSKLYPDYDKWLEKSMVLETQGYFAEVFNKNLSIREFLVSDWTMANPRLAMHYQFPPLKESGMQRVALRPEDHRGGLLTQAAVLSLTSDGTRHRPVHRGIWIYEAIFGRSPPQPPPNVEPLMPTPNDKPKATVRMQIEAHSVNAVCASCHKKIDPLGLAFDNYDAVGQWRTEERVTSGLSANPPVNATGVLPDGRAYNGPEEFKTLLAQDVDRFAEALTGQLATYGLRRAMTVSDQTQIRQIAQSCKAEKYPLQTLILNLATSDLFQQR